MAFSYAINGVADLDQRWDALPENGANYCVPTAAMNWMYFFAANGQTSAIPFRPGATNSNRILNILHMGIYMDTDAEDGTSWDDGVDGLLDWLEDRNIPALVIAKRAPDNGNLTYVSFRNKLQQGAHIIVSRGRYKKDGSEFERTGGHVMSVVELNRTDANVITMGVHNPNNDGNLNTQDPVHVQRVTLTQATRNLEGDHVEVLRWGAGTDPYQFVDGYRAILPLFALTNLTSGALTGYFGDLNSGGVDTRRFPLPFDGDLADLALQPSASCASVISRKTGEVWTLDLGDGTWSKAPGVHSAQLLAYGGRYERLHVVNGREISAFDEKGNRLGKIDAGVAIDAISYDQKNDRLIVASAAAKRLLAISPKLETLGQIEAPDVPGTGRLTLSVNSRDATVVMTREGSSEAATVRWHPTGALARGRFRLLADGATSAAHVTRKGRLFVSEAGKIATFDIDGNRVSGSIFEGLRAGALLKVARSSNNTDPARSRRKEWRE